jgi:hypothetical protein
MELLRSLNKSTLHELLCSPELQMLNEDSLLQTLIELGSEYFEYWCYIEANFLSSAGISLFVERLNFDHLTESIWLKIVDRLKQSEIHDFTFKSTSICQRYFKSVGFESVIIKDYPMILNEFKRKT